MDHFTPPAQPNFVTLPWLTTERLVNIAFALIDTHGAHARAIADAFIITLKSNGEDRVAHAWQALADLIDEAEAGRLSRAIPLVH